MNFAFRPMTEAAARAMLTWRYPGQYSFYDLDADPEDLAEHLDASTWPGRYFAVYDGDGDLVGSFSYDASPDTVDIGLGLRPDLTGRGLGFDFVRAGLEFGRELCAPAHFRLSVAAFNQRAVRIYERAGFAKTRTFTQRTNGGAYEFVEMELDERSAIGSSS